MNYFKLMVPLFLFFISISTYAIENLNIPILVYHNFNPTTPGSMSITPKKFEEQILWIKKNNFTIVSLKDVVEYLQGKKPNLPQKSIVITADDGWESVYQYMYPIVKKYQFPVTLFIYPQTISSGKHAMTWAQLNELEQTKLFDVQSHTYSHPNFKQEKRHLSSSNYQNFVIKELVDPKKILEEKMNKKITLLAWPFGIYDAYLENEAKKAGYEMAFSIDARPANQSFHSMAQPRFMIIDSLSQKTFEGIINRANNSHHSLSQR